EIDLWVSFQILLVPLDVQVSRADADQLRSTAGRGPSRAIQLITICMDGPPEVRELEPEDGVGIGDEGAGAIGMIERMAAREIHAATLINHGRLEKLSELHEQGEPCRCPRSTIGHENGAFGRNQESSDFRNGA